MVSTTSVILKSKINLVWVKVYRADHLKGGKEMEKKRWVLIFSAVCLALAFSVSPVEAQLPPGGIFGCQCYFNSDCGGWDYCGAGWLCRDQGKNDGQCSIYHWPGQPGVENLRAVMASSLDLRLRAYEVALEKKGGPPDSRLMQQARELPLPPESHEDLKRVAAFVQVMLHGLDRKGWSFVTVKPLDDSSSYPSDPFDFGSLVFGESQNPTPLGVAKLVRSAMVGEVRDPGQGIYVGSMNRIRSDFPNFKPVHRCEWYCQVKPLSATIGRWNHFIEATAFRLKSSVTPFGSIIGSR